MSAYYNENDPKAAAWLRELISAGLIAPGEVDERSIEDVAPEEIKGFTQCHFFAGIGGWSYALRLAGWSDAQPVWTGSCPCQPFSAAGRGAGVDDARHLWPIWRWLIDQCRPATVFGEQVASKAGRGWLAGVRADLEELGYGVGAADLCAAGVGAPHIRQRLWWVADAEWPRRWPERGACSGVAREHSVQRRGQEDPDRHAVRCPAGGLADTQRNAAEPRRAADESGESASAARTGTHAEPGRRGGAGGLADTERQGPQRFAGDGEGRGKSRRHLPKSAGSYWATSIWTPCADGKARRIEPSTEPLVDGLPGRVGLLRGYGNAIVSQVAAEFVGAYLDVR